MELFEIISEIFFKVTDNIIGGIYHSTTQIFTNTLFNLIASLAIVIYLIKKLAKNETFNASEVYPVACFILLYLTIFAIVYNESYYYEVLEFLQFPRNSISYIVMNVLGESHKTPTELLKSIATSINATQTILDEADGSWFSFNFTAKMLSVIFFLISLVLIVVLSGIIILSSLIARILISFFAIFAILAFWKPTRGFFFSWLRTYISFSLYAPLGILIGAVAVEFGKFGGTIATGMGAEQTLDLSAFIAIISGMVLCIFLLLLIPTFINSCLGTSNNGTTGASGMIGFLGGVAGGLTSKAIDFARDKAPNKLQEMIENYKNNGKDGKISGIDPDSRHH